MEPSIFIGLPCLDWIKTETTVSLISAANRIKYPTRLHVQQGTYIHNSRNKIVSAFLESTASHLMFVDSDIQFPPDGINHLMEQKKDIIGGIYYRRQPPHFPIINMIREKRLDIPHSFPIDKIFKVDVLGTGFMLIKREVFKKIKPPYFSFGNFHGKSIGEDVYFCLKARERFDIWADPTLYLGHIGEHIYTNEDYLAYREHIQAEVKKAGKIEEVYDFEL